MLSPIKMPAADVLFECLNLYQTDFRKPSLTVYCLDYSGSMSGEGNEQLVQAMEQLLIQENARKNFLQASENEVNILIPFNGGVIDTYTATGNGSELEALYDKVENQEVGGGTDMYAAAVRGIELLGEYDLSQYTPAIILLTDGQSAGPCPILRRLTPGLELRSRSSPSCLETLTKPNWRSWRGIPMPGCSTAGRI